VRLSSILARLESLGVPGRAIEVTRPTLEDVFLNLTGRSLRD
jgi:ABC-2 type transport system ATP-binding protein